MDSDMPPHLRHTTLYATHSAREEIASINVYLLTRVQAQSQGVLMVVLIILIAGHMPFHSAIVKKRETAREGSRNRYLPATDVGGIHSMSAAGSELHAAHKKQLHRYTLHKKCGVMGTAILLFRTIKDVFMGAHAPTKAVVEVPSLGLWVSNTTNVPLLALSSLPSILNSSDVRVSTRGGRQQHRAQSQSGQFASVLIQRCAPRDLPPSKVLLSMPSSHHFPTPYATTRNNVLQQSPASWQPTSQVDIAGFEFKNINIIGVHYSAGPRSGT
ncbi:hypothetical protein P692DRAFT_201902653 [Suillus brevipes Sb2]|nr:hypothetical protein P692DRAFT_201902653 [Suillus brevipes Sb2]